MVRAFNRSAQKLGSCISFYGMSPCRVIVGEGGGGGAIEKPSATGM